MLTIFKILFFLAVVCYSVFSQQTCSGGCFNSSSCDLLKLPNSRGSCRENRVCCGVTCFLPPPPPPPSTCSVSCFGSSNGRCPGSTTPASGSCPPGGVCCRNAPPPPPPPQSTCSASCFGSSNGQCPGSTTPASGSCPPGCVCCRPSN